MTDRIPGAVTPPAPYEEAADLLQGLEALRAELGDVADELIVVMRNAGIIPPSHHPDES